MNLLKLDVHALRSGSWAVLAGCVVGLSVLAVHAQPNVVIVVADDMSARELSLYDPTATAVTPTLNMMANQGLYINTAWATPICSSSRAQLMTGRYGFQTGWYGNQTILKDAQGNLVHDYQTSPLGIGQITTDAGYATIWAGKTQVVGADLTAYGFEEGIFTPGVPRLANPYTNFHSITPTQETSYFWWPGIQRMNHPGDINTFAWMRTTIDDYGPDVLLDGVFDLIHRNTNDPDDPTDDAEPTRPFFALYNANLTHLAPDFLNGTIDPQTGYYNTVQTYPGTPEVVNGVKTGNVTANTLDSHIEYLDYQMSQLIEELDRLEVLDDTIIIFTSENGTKNYGKSSRLRQRGNHIPMIMYAPGGQLAVQGRQDIIMDLTDVLPTVADLIGYQFPDDYQLGGKSLAPYLLGETTEHRDWVYSTLEQYRYIRTENVIRDGFGRWWDARATTNGDDKMVQFLPGATTDPVLKQDVALLMQLLEEIPDLRGDAPLYYQFLKEDPDFNGDAVVNGLDIDILTTKLGLTPTGENEVYDLNDDGLINTDDRDYLISALVQTTQPFHLGTVRGDADLDGDVDEADMGLAFGEYTGPDGTGKGWALGNFDLDADIDDADLADIFEFYTGPGQGTPPIPYPNPVTPPAEPAVPAVPEPASVTLLALGGLALLRRRSDTA